MPSRVVLHRHHCRAVSLGVWCALCAIVVCCVVGCATPVVQADDGARVDAFTDGHADTSAPDAAAPDATLDAADAGLHCMGRETISVEAVGLMMDGIWHVTGDNETASDNVDDAVQAERSDCTFRSVRQRLYHYRMRSRAALRVSTDHAGTSPGFDTVLALFSPPCGATSTSVLACNDDNPFVPRGPANVRSLATTAVLEAGTAVIISVAGYHPAFGSGRVRDLSTEAGAFELSISEIVPLAADVPCDVRGFDNVCDRDASCITATVSGGMASCVRLGSVAGSNCIDRMACAGTLQCDTDNNTCFESVGLGATCHRLGVARARCAAGFVCSGDVTGALAGTCLPAGTVVGGACGEGLTCIGADLQCVPTGATAGVCMRVAEAGGGCNVSETACGAGATCVGSTPGANIGACTSDGRVAGTVCRGEGFECDDPLFCVTTAFTDRRCRTVSDPGGACGTFGSCRFDADCVRFDPSRPYEGTCVPRGAQGGVCLESGSACEMGLTCTNPSNRDAGRCVRVAAAGDACNASGVGTSCVTGHTCVREMPSGFAGVCRVDGAAAGTACRAASPRCDTGLACTAAMGAGRCVRDVARGAACDVRYATTRCASGTFCRATSIDAGTCEAATGEVEPNDAPSTTGTPPAGAVAYRGVIDRYDVDCFAVEISAGGALFAQATANDGRCSANLAMDVYRLLPRLERIGSDSDSGPYGCARVDGTDRTRFGWASSLSAGRYGVCVREGSNRFAAGAYVLSVTSR